MRTIKNKYSADGSNFPFKTITIKRGDNNTNRQLLNFFNYKSDYIHGMINDDVVTVQLTLAHYSNDRFPTHRAEVYNETEVDKFIADINRFLIDRFYWVINDVLNNNFDVSSEYFHILTPPHISHLNKNTFIVEMVNKFLVNGKPVYHVIFDDRLNSIKEIYRDVIGEHSKVSNKIFIKQFTDGIDCNSFEEFITKHYKEIGEPKVIVINSLLNFNDKITKEQLALKLRDLSRNLKVTIIGFDDNIKNTDAHYRIY